MAEPKPNMKEVGVSGLNYMTDMVNEAHTAELKWPQCIPAYNRIWRSDPEVTIARNVLSAWAGGIEISAETPVGVGEGDVPSNDDDEKAKDFLNTIIEDVDNTFVNWLKDCISKVPFYGWGWWEVMPGLRKEGWKAPGKGDNWESNYDDGLVGIRRISHRRYSSFAGWEFQDNGTITALKQYQQNYEIKTIPLDKSLHIVYGDLTSPEGVGTLEAIWRLERIKYGLEIAQGIGYEHSAGHLSVTIEEGGEFNQEHIQKVARNILTAQPGNYAAWPAGVVAEFIDAKFGSAESILNAIRYYGILKLALLGMQFVTISTLTGSGSYAAMSDASDIAISIFNNIARSIIEQVNKQLVRRIFSYEVNKKAFPNITRLPEISMTEIKKPFDLGEFGSLISILNAIMKLSPRDLDAIRKETGFMPQATPEELDAAAATSEGVSTPKDESQPKPGEPPKNVSIATPPLKKKEPANAES